MMAATSYNQTSRRTANSNATAESSENNSVSTNTSRSTSANTATNNRATRTNTSTPTRTTTTTTRTTTSSPSRSSSTSSRTTTTSPTRSSGTTTRTTTSPTRSTGTTTRTATTSPTRNSGTSSRTTTSRTVNNNNSYSVNNNRSAGSNNSHKNARVVYSDRAGHAHYSSSRKYTGHHQPTHVYRETPRTKVYRSQYHTYRSPQYVNIVWSRNMHRNYISMYPEVRYWNYDVGYRINSISAYRADLYVGNVMNVYGRVDEVYYSHETDEYFLYVGLHYPYQDFTVIVPGDVARRYSRRPGYYFNNQYIQVTGLISQYDSKPEIVVKRNSQLNLY